MIVEGCKLIQTCPSNPEQYEVFWGDREIGYLRLRHGWFRADYPSCGGQTVYQAYPACGSACGGMFAENERSFFLKEAVRAILKAVSENN